LRKCILEMLKTRCDTAVAFPPPLTSIFPFIGSMCISLSRSRISMRKSWFENSQRSNRTRITTYSWGCSQGKFRAIIVSKVPIIVSFPPFSCAKSQNVKSSILILYLRKYPPIITYFQIFSNCFIKLDISLERGAFKLRPPFISGRVISAACSPSLESRGFSS